MKYIYAITLWFAVISIVLLDVSFSGDIPTSQSTLQTYSNTGIYTLIYSESSRAILNKISRFYQVLENEDIIKQYKENYSELPNYDSLLGNKELRRVTYQNRIILFTLTNVVYNDNFITLVNQIINGPRSIRIIQYIGKDMNIQTIWEDELPTKMIDYSHGMEPFALSEDGLTAGLGEHGEIVVYSQSGIVIKSVVFKGVYDESRTPKIRSMDENKYSYLSKDVLELLRSEDQRILELKKEMLRVRDRSMVGKVLKAQEIDYANINGLFFLPNKSLNVLVGSRTIYSIDLKFGQTKVMDISGLIQNESIPGDDLIYQVLCKNWDLYLLTNHRVVQLRMEEGIQKIGETRIKKQVDTINQWNVLQGKRKDRDTKLFIEFTRLGKRIIELNSN